jgi:hypothetical protein
LIQPQTVVVGRKTPGDGKIEVSPELAATLGGDGSAVDVRLQGRGLTGAVSVMECTCAKASTSGKHEHHFVQCDAFRALPIGTELSAQAAPGRLTLSPQ